MVVNGAIILLVFIVFGVGVYFGTEIERAKHMTYLCCDHCYDPITGELTHDLEEEDEHKVPCNEAKCEEGREHV